MFNDMAFISYRGKKIISLYFKLIMLIKVKFLDYMNHFSSIGGTCHLDKKITG